MVCETTTIPSFPSPVGLEKREGYFRLGNSPASHARGGPASEPHLAGQSTLVVRPQVGLLSVGPGDLTGLGDLTDKRSPGHVHGRVNLHSFRSRIILEDFHHQGCVVRRNNTSL